MVDISAIAGMLSALKGATDISKAMLDLRDGQLIQAKVIELQFQILAAQSSAFAANDERSALIDRVRSLEEELAGLEKWDTGKDQYRLTQIATGAFAYTPQPNADRAEPPHWLCVKCYDGRQRSVLQYQGRTSNDRESNYACPVCKSTIRVPWNRTPEKVAPESSAEPATAAKKKPPGDQCPRCKEDEYRLEKSTPHRQMGDMGVNVHHMKCDACGFTEEKLITP